MKQGSLVSSKMGSMKNWGASTQYDVVSKMSKMSVRTDVTTMASETSSQTTPRSARMRYLNSLMGKTLTVLRPHPRNMVDSLKQLADEVECTASIKRALVEHVKKIETLVMSNRKAGAMMNKTMMHWRMLLKPKTVDEVDVMRMIEDVEEKMDRIKHQLDLSEGKLSDEILPTRLYQCFLDDGLRIILFDSNENIKDYVQSAIKMRKGLRSLQRKVNMSEYFENVKEWVMDAVVATYAIMAIDTVTALKLHPLIKDLARNVKDGSVIETQFVNRLRTFNVCLHRVLAEAKLRRCQTLCPLDDILAKMSTLDNVVANRADPEDDTDVRTFVEKLKKIDGGEYEGLHSELEAAREKANQVRNCEPVVLRNRYKKIVPRDLFPPFV